MKCYARDALQEETSEANNRCALSLEGTMLRSRRHLSCAGSLWEQGRSLSRLGSLFIQVGLNMSQEPSTKRHANKQTDDTTMKQSSGVTSTNHRAHRGDSVVSAWDRNRAPFILYLRSFRVTIYHGPDQRMLLENHLWATLSPAIGVLTIVDPEEVPLPGAYGHGAPALAVPNERWQQVVSDLIGKAEMIISEVPVLSAGAKFELETCVEKGRIGQTIVIIPSPDGPFPLLDDEETITRFPRVMCYDELPAVGAHRPLRIS